MAPAAIRPRGSHESLHGPDHPSAIDTQAALTLCLVLDFKQQVRLAARGLAERDSHPMPESVTTPEAFYEVMAAAVLDAIDLPALLERVAMAERELDIIQEALRRADSEAKNARHQPTNDGEASEEPSIALILRGASTICEAKVTHPPHQSSLPRDGAPAGEVAGFAPEQSDAAAEYRESSTASPPHIRSKQTKATLRRQPNRPRRVSRRALVTHFHSPSWRKLLSAMRSVLPQSRHREIRGLHVEGRARAWAERFKEPTPGVQPHVSGTQFR
jgi:hypothetical protein